MWSSQFGPVFLLSDKALAQYYPGVVRRQTNTETTFWSVGCMLIHIGLDVTDQRHEIETRATWLVWPRGYCVMQNHLQIADKHNRYQHETGGLCIIQARCLMQWMNEWGLRPPLCTYRLNWIRRTSSECWDEWDDTALQTQDSKFDTGGLRPSSIPLGHKGSPK